VLATGKRGIKLNNSNRQQRVPTNTLASSLPKDYKYSSIFALKHKPFHSTASPLHILALSDTSTRQEAENLTSP
jgi:hypothetical protein